MFSYTVIAEFDSRDVAAEWLEWLRSEHLREVCEAGALDAEAIDVDAPSGSRAPKVRCEVRYHFASRAAFDAYERDHAPRLRAEGLRRFPPERRVRYERSTGVVAATAARGS